MSLSEFTSQTSLLSDSSSSLQEVTFSETEYQAGTLISNIKYRHSGYQHDNVFYPFDNDVDYALAHWFVESKITKGNVDKFLTNFLMKSITKQLSYWNTIKWEEKLSLIL